MPDVDIAELDEAAEIAEAIRAELERLGCECLTAVTNLGISGDRSTATTLHKDDCPAVAYYSDPVHQRPHD